MELNSQEPPPFVHISRNEFLHRKHKKQKEEDISTCECLYSGDPKSACGERCLNFLTSTECTPGYCLCGEYCRNQRFQKCEYIKLRLVRTEGRGWGLLADEDVKTGQFIIEYSGEVISWKEAKRRSQTYESQGQADAYIISLDAYESIDATRKGSLARFINHSCQPNCETRKWNVLGEVRVGIFAKEDIRAGTELSYNYNFEWYGGAVVRCLCGSINCSGFLGAKSRGFQEAAYVWEDDDGRFSVENVPLYDSADDEVFSKPTGGTVNEYMHGSIENLDRENSLFMPMPVGTLGAVPEEDYCGMSYMVDLCMENISVIEDVEDAGKLNPTFQKYVCHAEEGSSMIHPEVKTGLEDVKFMDMKIKLEGAVVNNSVFMAEKVAGGNISDMKIEIDGLSGADTNIKNQTSEIPIVNDKIKDELDRESNYCRLYRNIKQETAIEMKSESSNGVYVCEGSGQEQNDIKEENNVHMQIVPAQKYDSNHAHENHHRELVPFEGTQQKRLKKSEKARAKKQVNAASICKLLSSEEARQEVLQCEAAKKFALSELDQVYEEEIRPMVDQGLNIGSMPMDVVGRWVDVTCSLYKADVGFYSVVVEKLFPLSQRTKLWEHPS